MGDGDRRLKVVLPVCPRCGSRQVVPIVYGLPGKQLAADADAGRVVLGGCRVSDGDPIRSCVACGHRWGSFRERTPPTWPSR